MLQKKHKAEFDKMREFLSQRYLTDFARLNSLDYGVPQSRERLFMIGIRRDLIKAPVAGLGLFMPHVPKTGGPNGIRSTRMLMRVLLISGLLQSH